jgi:RNA polymerase sigma factor (sigma-70 family)
MPEPDISLRRNLKSSQSRFADTTNSAVETAPLFYSDKAMAELAQGRAVWLSRNVLPHEPMLRSWLRRRQLFDLEVDDIVQETYAKLAALTSVDSIRDPRNYLIQVANSLLLVHLRRSRIVSITSAANPDEFGIAAPEATPEESVEYRDELRILLAALASLPLGCRTALVLRRVVGLSQRETAQRLGVSEKTIEKYMAKSVRLLMDKFGRGGKSAPEASSNTAKVRQSDYERAIIKRGD